MSSTSSVANAAKLNIKGVHHISFRVDDLDASMLFYSRTLGFQPIERADLGFRGAWLKAGDVELHLLEVPGTGATGTNPSEPTALANHLGLGVDELGPVRSYFEQQRVPVHVRSGYPSQLWVQDPDGNVVEFIARSSR
jgi:glyoxylase I family protein